MNFILHKINFSRDIGAQKWPFPLHFPIFSTRTELLRQLRYFISTDTMEFGVLYLFEPSSGMIPDWRSANITVYPPHPFCIVYFLAFSPKGFSRRLSTAQLVSTTFLTLDYCMTKRLGAFWRLGAFCCFACQKFTKNDLVFVGRETSN